MTEGTQNSTTESSSNLSNGSNDSALANDKAAEIEAKLQAKLAQVTQVVSADGITSKISSEPAKEVSAATIGRMLGLATSAELALLESKLDLISTKLSNIQVRMEKVSQLMVGSSTGADVERIDAQLAALRSLIKDALPHISKNEGDQGKK